MTIHVHLKLVIPQQNPRCAGDIHSGVEHHLPLRHVGNKASSVLGQLQPVEPSRQPEQLARFGGLRAGLDLGRAEKRAVVEDGHGGGGVVDGGDVGVGDMYGEDEVSFEDWEVELEGGEVD